MGCLILNFDEPSLVNPCPAGFGAWIKNRDRKLLIPIQSRYGSPSPWFIKKHELDWPILARIGWSIERIGWSSAKADLSLGLRLGTGDPDPIRLIPVRIGWSFEPYFGGQLLRSTFCATALPICREKDPMILNRSYLELQIPSLSMKSRSNCISVYNGFNSIPKFCFYFTPLFRKIKFIPFLPLHFTCCNFFGNLKLAQPLVLHSLHQHSTLINLTK